MRGSTFVDKYLTQLANSFDLSAFLKVTGLTIQDLEADSKYYAQEQTKETLRPDDLSKNDPYCFFSSSPASSLANKGFEQNVSTTPKP